MFEWNLSEHGDIEERTWWAEIGPNFPNYEVFWREYIVPLTCRRLNPSNIFVRPRIPKHLRDLVNSHYSVFLQLSSSYHVLESPDALTTQRGIYDFYSHLCSVKDMVQRFLRMTNNVFKHYGSIYIPRRARRLARFGDASLEKDYRTALADIKKYRRQSIHDYAPIMIDGKIPKPNRLKKYTDLATLAQVLGAPDRDQIISRDFVDAKTRCREDLQRLEKVLDRIWSVVLREFEEMRDLEKYRADQAMVTEDDIAFCKSMTFRISGDSPGFSGSAGVTSGSAWIWSKEV